MRLLLLASILLFTGCANQSITPTSSSNNFIKLTPLSDVTTGFKYEPNSDFSAAYTRLIIVDRGIRGVGYDQSSENSKSKNQTYASNPNCSTLDQDEICYESVIYPYNDRGLFWRFLWGTKHDINLTANVNVSQFSATVPLATIEHISNRNDGENFSRIINHSAQQFPLFLIKGDGSNGIASVKFKVKSSDEYQSSYASTTLQAIQTATSLISPQSAVLTKLTEQKTKDLANSLDKVVSEVFARTLSEEQWIENDIRRWNKGVNIIFRIPPPENEGEWEKVDYSSNALKTVGVWKVTFESPRPSIFSDAMACGLKDSGANNHKICFNNMDEARIEAKKEAKTRPSEILSFQLVSGVQNIGTVIGYLKQQEFWTPSLTSLSSGKEPKDSEITKFCRFIKTAITALNLNTTDAEIIVGAVRDAAILPDNVSNKIASQQEECYKD